MIHQWHIVFLAGFAGGYFARWLVSKLARVFNGPWLVVLVCLSTQACAGFWMGIGLRTAGAIASGVHAANQAKKEIAAAEARGFQEEPDDGTLQWQQKHAREKAARDLAEFDARRKP